MANEVSVKAGERKYVDFALTYSSDWSEAAKQGDPVIESEVSAVYFHVKRNKTDSTKVLELDTTDATEVDWVTVGATEKIRVKLGANTLALHGDYLYELRLKLTGGDYISAVESTLTVGESITGNP